MSNPFCIYNEYEYLNDYLKNYLICKLILLYFIKICN